MQTPDVKERLAGMGDRPAHQARPEEFAAYLKREIAKWGDVVRKANLKAD
jgi:tripartite-type tricarboxylate transporter receptor subunit TctC